ncbi:hypothetical protein [Mucilaginibacter glaciei]|uniref:hypothetical protein n=1 Tax=Mucilaginibacter glaciei TaxID=2772109 RepID=UPI001CD11371|nr:hypothetical protein [Mucilaginibacter glaciei]
MTKKNTNDYNDSQAAELTFQVLEKEKRAAELLIANKELDFQNKEKEKRAAELIIANAELSYQSEEKSKRAAELVIANKELVFQNQEKEKRANELSIAYDKIKETEGFLKEYIAGLEKMMFMTHHKVRQPVANILGLAHTLEFYLTAPATLKELVSHMQTSAADLDTFTRELTAFIEELERKAKEKESE